MRVNSLFFLFMNMISKNAQELFNNYIAVDQVSVSSETSVALELLYKAISAYESTPSSLPSPRSGDLAIRTFKGLVDTMDRQVQLIAAGGATAKKILKFDDISFLIYPNPVDMFYNPICSYRPVLIYAAFLEWIYNNLEIPSLQDFIKDDNSLLSTVDNKADEIEKYIKEIFVGSEVYYYHRPPRYWSRTVYPKKSIYIRKGTISDLENIFSHCPLMKIDDRNSNGNLSISLFRSECEEKVDCEIEQMIEKFNGNVDFLKKRIDREKVSLARNEKLYNNLITEEKEILDKIKNKTMIWKDC